MIAADVTNLACAVADLRNEVRQLRSEMQRRPAAASSEDRPLVLISFGRDGEGRRPYTFHLRGKTMRLSSVRYAIVFALMLDLYNRSQGGPGLKSVKAAIRECYEALEPVRRSYESLRVGVYRALEAIDIEGLSFDPYKIRLDRSGMRLELFEPGSGGPVEPEALRFELSVEEPLLAPFLNRLGGLSMLERVRRTKSMLLPPGPESIDRLLVELYDSDYTLCVSDVYFRIANLTYPRALLEKMNASETLMHRIDNFQRRLQQRRIEVNSIVPLASLWELITKGPDGEFLRYAKGTAPEEVISHLDRLLWLTTSGCYSLIFTTMEPPILFVLYEMLKNGAVEDALSVFVKHEHGGKLHDVSGLLVNDVEVCRATKDNLLEWAKTHPRTVREEREVRAAIGDVKRYLIERGPILHGQDWRKEASRIGGPASCG